MFARTACIEKTLSFSVPTLAWLVYLLPSSYPYFDRKGAEISEYLIWDFVLALEESRAYQIRSNPLTPCIVTSVQHSLEIVVLVLLSSKVGSMVQFLYNTLFSVHELCLNPVFLLVDFLESY